MEQLRRHHPEEIRPLAPRPIGSGTGSGDGSDTSGTVQITWGALVDDVQVVGMTVGEVQAELQDVYNLAPGVRINVNGAPADSDTRLAAGDSLEFVRSAGEKGAG